MRQAHSEVRLLQAGRPVLGIGWIVGEHDALVLARARAIGIWLPARFHAQVLRELQPTLFLKLLDQRRDVVAGNAHRTREEDEVHTVLAANAFPPLVLSSLGGLPRRRFALLHIRTMGNRTKGADPRAEAVADDEAMEGAHVRRDDGGDAARQAPTFADEARLAAALALLCGDQVVAMVVPLFKVFADRVVVVIHLRRGVLVRGADVLVGGQPLSARLPLALLCWFSRRRPVLFDRRLRGCVCGEVDLFTSVPPRDNFLAAHVRFRHGGTEGGDEERKEVGADAAHDALERLHGVHTDRHVLAHRAVEAPELLLGERGEERGGDEAIQSVQIAVVVAQRQQLGRRECVVVCGELRGVVHVFLCQELRLVPDVEDGPGRHLQRAEDRASLLQVLERSVVRVDVHVAPHQRRNVLVLHREEIGDGVGLVLQQVLAFVGCLPRRVVARVARPSDVLKLLAPLADGRFLVRRARVQREHPQPLCEGCRHQSGRGFADPRRCKDAEGQERWLRPHERIREAPLVHCNQPPRVDAKGRRYVRCHLFQRLLCTVEVRRPSLRLVSGVSHCQALSVLVLDEQQLYGDHRIPVSQHALKERHQLLGGRGALRRGVDRSQARAELREAGVGFVVQGVEREQVLLQQRNCVGAIEERVRRAGNVRDLDGARRTPLEQPLPRLFASRRVADAVEEKLPKLLWSERDCEEAEVASVRGASVGDDGRFAACCFLVVLALRLCRVVIKGDERGCRRHKGRFHPPLHLLDDLVVLPHLGSFLGRPLLLGSAMLTLPDLRLDVHHLKLPFLLVLQRSCIVSFQWLLGHKLLESFLELCVGFGAGRRLFQRIRQGALRHEVGRCNLVDVSDTDRLPALPHFVCGVCKLLGSLLGLSVLLVVARRCQVHGFDQTVFAILAFKCSDREFLRLECVHAVLQKRRFHVCKVDVDGQLARRRLVHRQYPAVGADAVHCNLFRRHLHPEFLKGRRP